MLFIYLIYLNVFPVVMQLCWPSKLSFFSTISFYSSNSSEHHIHLFVVFNRFATRKSRSNKCNHFISTRILYSITCRTCWRSIWTSCYSRFKKHHNIRTSKLNKITEYSCIFSLRSPENLLIFNKHHSLMEFYRIGYGYVVHQSCHN